MTLPVEVQAGHRTYIPKPPQVHPETGMWKPREGGSGELKEGPSTPQLCHFFDFKQIVSLSEPGIQNHLLGNPAPSAPTTANHSGSVPPSVGGSAGIL